MANYLSSNEKFHVFSKSPITSTQALAQSVNKSGHTTTTSDVWSQDIPWFFTTDSQAKAIGYSKNARTNDLVDINGVVYKRKDTKDAPYNASGSFDSMWEPYSLYDGLILENSQGEGVIKVHQGVEATLLTTGNNANQSSFSAARIWVGGVLIPQFVQSTDKIIDGFPATGYGVSLWNNGNPISEGEANGNFIANSYAGIIQLNQDYTNPKFTANVFEYIGKKLDVTVSELAAAVFGEGGSSGEDVSLTQKVAQNTAAIKLLNGSSTETGSVAKAVADAVSALESSVKTTTDALQDAIDTLNGSETTTGSVAKAVADAEGRVKVTTDALAGRIAQLEGITHFSVEVVDALPTAPVENTIYLVAEEGVAEGTYIEYIAYKPAGSETVVTEKIGSTALDLSGYTTDDEHSALAGRVTTVEGKVTTLEGQVATLNGTETTAGSVAKALADAKTYADSKASAAQAAAESTASAALTSALEQVAEDIEAAKNEAIASAEVTITAGTGIVVEGAGKGTTFEIAVSDDVATAASVTALSEVVASNYTDLDGKITTAQTTLQGNIDGVSGRVTTLEDQVSALTTGENSVDTKIATAVEEIEGEISEAVSTLEGKITTAQ